MGLLEINVRDGIIAARARMAALAFGAGMALVAGPDDPLVRAGKRRLEPGEVARMLRAIERLADKLGVEDLGLDDGEVQDALASLSFGYGFVRLATRAGVIRSAGYDAAL